MVASPPAPTPPARSNLCHFPPAASLSKIPVHKVRHPQSKRVRKVLPPCFLCQGFIKDYQSKVFVFSILILTLVVRGGNVPMKTRHSSIFWLRCSFLSVCVQEAILCNIIFVRKEGTLILKSLVILCLRSVADNFMIVC